MTVHELWVAIFWFSLVVVVYTFVGYPFFVLLLSRFSRRRTVTSPANAPDVTVVLAVHNEAQRIEDRLTNLLATHYPPEKLQIIVVSDGSTDGTVPCIQALGEARIQVITRPNREGKAACLNTALALARSELIVFADARQRFEPDAIPKLALHFQNPTVGAVSGELVIDSAESAVGGGVDVYWRFEKVLRHAEARWDSCIGCTGAIYAIRRSLFQELKPDTILDDVVVPMRIATQGYRVAFEPGAVAHDPQALEPQREAIRKRRTLAGNFQMFFRHPAWLLPWRNRLWWQLLSHKYLRLAAPWFLLLMFVVNLALGESPVYRWLFIGQCVFYALAAIGIAFRGAKSLLFSAPAGFVFLNAMAAHGLWHYLFADELWQMNGNAMSPPVARRVSKDQTHV